MTACVRYHGIHSQAITAMPSRTTAAVGTSLRERRVRNTTGMRRPCFS